MGRGFLSFFSCQKAVWMVQECLTRWCMYRLCKHLEPVELMTLAALSVNMSGRRREHEVNTDEHSYPFGRSFLKKKTSKNPCAIDF